LDDAEGGRLACALSFPVKVNKTEPTDIPTTMEIAICQNIDTEYFLFFVFLTFTISCLPVILPSEEKLYQPCLEAEPLAEVVTKFDVNPARKLDCTDLWQFHK
jgi:hypothetical protein